MDALVNREVLVGPEARSNHQGHSPSCRSPEVPLFAQQGIERR